VSCKQYRALAAGLRRPPHVSVIFASALFAVLLAGIFAAMFAAFAGILAGIFAAIFAAPRAYRRRRRA